MINIITSSPQALAISTPDLGGRPAKYPFAELNVGQSFTIPLSEVKLTSFRPYVSTTGKKMGKRFACLVHNEMDPPIVEVARVS